MVHCVSDQDEWLVRRARPVLGLWRMWRCSSPRIIFAVNECQAVVGDVVPSVLVDDVCVRGCGDVEGFPADDLRKVEVDEARDERELGFRHATAGLKEAPLRAVLIWPAAPGLREVVLLIIGAVVRGPALVLCLPLGCAVCNGEGLIRPAGKVQ